MIIRDGYTRLSITILEEPPLVPPELAEADEAGEFLSWWIAAAIKRGFQHGRWPVAEEWIHARRLLTQHTPEQLRLLAVHFFAAFARDEWRGPQLLRMFWHLLPNVEEEARTRGG